MARSPLTEAIVFAMDRAVPVTVPVLATWAGVAPSRAKAVVTQLVCADVLLPDLTPGPQWTLWRQALPGGPVVAYGNARQYRDARADAEREYYAERWQWLAVCSELLARRLRLGLTQAELAQLTGVQLHIVKRIERRRGGIRAWQRVRQQVEQVLGAFQDAEA